MNLHHPEIRRARLWPWRLGLSVLAVLLVLGPWPVDDSTFEGSAYQARTLDRLDRAPKVGPAGSIRVGLAEVDLTPGSPRPLAGFIGQVRTPYVGVDTPCLARALTVATGSRTVTILTADLLLINAKLAKAVSDRAGVGLDEVYFTSSHTHGGPGGWGDHPLEMLVAGAYDPRFFDELADKLAEVVRASRAKLEPAEFGFVQVTTKNRQSNRVERGGSTHDPLSALIFRPIDPSNGTNPIAILTVFGAHATVSHPIPPRLGADYPSNLVAELKRRTGARMVLFAAGAVGDASPSRPRAVSQAQSAAILGAGLADDLMTALPLASFFREVELANLRLPVDLPPVRLPFLTRWLRFSPLATWWIADRETHLHAVRIGPAVLVGFPGDYSGDLADRLASPTRAYGLSLVATSFDGDFRGYLVSSRIFRDVSCYETRWMNFYGPNLGDYLNDLARRMVSQVTLGPVEASRKSRDDLDEWCRIILSILLAFGFYANWRRLGDLAASAGWGTLVILALSLITFLVRPTAIDWARFGLPEWVRLGGGPLGLLGLWLARKRPSRAPLTLGLAIGLLSANWLVVLILVRGWLKSRLRRAASIRQSGQVGHEKGFAGAPASEEVR